MKSYRLEILNPKALQLIEGMQNLNLIKISEEPSTDLQAYLKNMRQHSTSVPDISEITQMVEEVREERYAKK